MAPAQSFRDRLPLLIAAVGTPEFYREIADAIGATLSASYCLCFYYPPTGGPIHLNQTVLTPEIETGVRNYLTHTYLINPFYRRLADAGVTRGCFVMEDFLSTYVAHSTDEEFPIDTSQSEVIGYLTHGWPPEMREFILVADLGDGSVIEFSAMRPVRVGPYAADEASALNQFIDVIESLCRRQTTLLGIARKDSEHGTLDLWLETFGLGLLSRRERSVLRMVLQGYSSEAIALNLDIALPTVKTHRAKSYAKLGISSQAELLRAFLEHIQTSKHHPLG